MNDHANELERHLISKLTHIIQRFESEGIDLCADDINTIWRAKTYLGHSIPISIEQGTGSIVGVE